MTDVSENDSIRTEMIAMRSDLSGAIAAGLAAVNASIQTMSEQHHQAVLDQTRLNPTFAPRDRVEILSARVEDNAKRISAIENQHLELKTQLTAISAQLTAMSLQLAAITDRTLDKDHLEWVKHTRQRTMDHAATRVQFAKQLLGYLMIAVAGIIISGIGLGHLVSLLMGGH